MHSEPREKKSIEQSRKEIIAQPQEGKQNSYSEKLPNPPHTKTEIFWHRIPPYFSIQTLYFCLPHFQNGRIYFEEVCFVRLNYCWQISGFPQTGILKSACWLHDSNQAIDKTDSTNRSINRVCKSVKSKINKSAFLFINKAND